VGVVTGTAGRTPRSTAPTPARRRRVVASHPRFAACLSGAAPALVYLAGQAVTASVVVLIAAARHRLSWGLLRSWDGQHFLAIARHGYTHSVSAGVDASPAFFPGYPAAIRGLAVATGLPLTAAAVVVSIGCGIAFAYGLARLARSMVGADRMLGLLLVAVASVAPLSIVLTMTYSEALFCALAVWCLVFLVEHRWLAAGMFCAVAGTVRQTAVALVAAVVLACFLAVWQHVATWRTWAAAALAPLGLAGYLAYVAMTTGQLTGWFQAERNGWNTQVDFGSATGKFAYRAVLNAPSVLDVVTVAVLGLAVILLAAAVAVRAPTPLIVYATSVLLLDAVSDGIMNSKVRLLIPAFVLLIPFARWLRSQSRLALLTILTCVAVTGAWYSAYALVIYGYAI
jgi:hypothetical protein